MSKLILSIDLGGTKLSFSLSELDGKHLIYEKQNTESKFLSQLKQIYIELEKNWNRKIDVVSIGVPGPVTNGVLGPCAPLLNSKPISFIECFPNLETLFIRNDMYMATYAELKEGFGKKYNNFILVSISTGIGVGIVINNNLLNIRSEMGHQIISEAGDEIRTCVNHNNCWASYCSGSALGKNLTDNQYKKLKKFNTLAFSNLVAAYDPEIIVLMGGVALNLFEKMIPKSEDLSNYIMIDKPPIISPTFLSEKIGVIGASLFAQDSLNLSNV